MEQLTSEKRQLEKTLEAAKRDLALGSHQNGDVVPTIENLGSYAMIAKVFPGMDGKALRPIIERLRQNLSSGIIAVVGITEEGKAALAVSISP